MEVFGIYSLKAGVILTLFWGIYLLFLQKETFYRFNRGFLLTGLIAAIFLPLIIIRYTVEVSAPTIPAFPLVELETIPAYADKNATFLQICSRLIPVVYTVVLTVLLIVRSIGLTRLVKSIRQNKSKRYVGYHIIESSDFDGAFSFFRFVFIPPNLNETEKHIILKHENAHIKQKHWIDLLLTNTLSLIWWFNPVMWLYEKAIRNNHEYLADQDVLIDYQRDDYQQTLLNQWLKIPFFPITNSFTYTNNLKRIMMMKKNNSNPFKKLYAFLSVPVLALFLMAFAEKVYVEQDPQRENDSGIYTRGGSDTLMIRSTTTGKPLLLVDGKEIASLNGIAPADIESMSVLKNESAIAQYGEKGKDGVILITTKKFAAQKAEVEQQQVMMEQQKAGQSLSVRLKPTNGKNPLYIVDDKEVSSFDGINPADIESISVLKEGSVLSRFGERGYNGVVLITTKEGSRKND